MIAELLGTGRRAAKTAKELADLLNLDRRELSKLILAERKAGAPICATNAFPYW